MRLQHDALLHLATGTVLLLTLAGCGSSTDTATSPGSAEPLAIVALTSTTLVGTVGTPVDSIPAVRVTDKSGRPVAAAAVTFEVIAGGGALTGASTRTESDGTARPARWRLGIVAGQPNVVRARLSGDVGAWVEFTASAKAGAVGSLVAASGHGQAGFLGEALSEPLSVKVMDSFGNPIAGAVVTFSTSTDNGTINAPSATSNVAGIATSGTWTLGVTLAVQRARAAAGAAEFLFTASATAPCSSDCPTNQRLVYIRNGDIYAANTDGTEAVRLTATGTNSEPAWSPDGRSIAFVSNSSANSCCSSAIQIMGANGGNVRPFATAGYSPAWSPDGRTLAYSALDGGEFKIFVRPVNGAGSPRQVGFTSGYNRWASWSPDGSKLAFISDYSAYDFAYEVYVMNADGSDIVQLTNGFFGSVKTWPSYTMYGQPVWSPDGRRIALVSCPAWQYANCDESAIAVMSADGSALRVLNGAGGYARPAWSADGKYLAYAHTCWDNKCAPNVYSIPAEGGLERLLIPGAHSAQWRP